MSRKKAKRFRTAARLMAVNKPYAQHKRGYGDKINKVAKKLYA